MRIFTTNKLTRDNEKNYGAEFSILTSQRYNSPFSKDSKSVGYTSFLYALSILSIACWIVSLKILPFGDILQFLLGGVVLSVNLMVFKWTKL